MNTAQRKVQHLKIFETDPNVDRNSAAFGTVELTHRALPQLDLNDCDTGCDLFGYRLKFPLIISSMTGGSHEITQTINRNLAIAAQECNVALAVGSQRVGFDDPAAQVSFDLRKYAPTVPLISNLGAVQLNYGFDVDHCNKAIETLGADAIYLHLNPLQEAIQPEGNTNFANVAEKVAEVVEHCNKDVVLKEVGCGLSTTDIELGLEAGIKYFDIAGAGGTSWSRVEHHRRTNTGSTDTLGLTFQDWGITTVEALRQAARMRTESQLTFDLFASGGLRNGIDMVKSLILGARACGLAAPLLKPAMTSAQATVDTIAQLYNEFRIAMFLLGIDRVESLVNNDSLLANSSRPDARNSS